MSVCGSFLKGFHLFYQEQMFCDLLLSLNGRKYNTHQLVLVHSSGYFARMVQEQNSKGSTIVFDLNNLNRSNIVLTNDLFENILQYVYTGEIELNMETITPLKAAASVLEVKKLESLINKYLYRNLTQDHVPKVLGQALSVNSTQVVDHCLYIISKHFTYFFLNRDSLVELMNLPPKVMLAILTHEMLFTSSEDIIFDCLAEYLARNSISSKLSKSLWETVHFEKLSVQKRAQAKKLHLPRELMREEGKKPRLYGHVVDIYQDDTKENQGIIYYIATSGNTREWENPHKSGKVVGSLSSVEKGKVENIFDFSKKLECWTNDIPASYLTIDFGEDVTLLPTHYTIRHGSNSKQDCLRIWLLLASNDNSNWKVLSRHKDDKFLNSAFATHTWKIPTQNFLEPEPSEASEGDVVASDRYGWRYFRICQTGHNVSMTNFLSISGVEFYGECFQYIAQ
eukprot:TRINITY_DN648_c0_g1_i1.p1 TRINITY_DN648_c0_g1~~TRINITY_DN648_c0_g1_i1.p1  ORF type:complete len:460 (-),score=44.09 TRINITY_DN648_c0_g1_i1:86-1444(-)